MNKDKKKTRKLYDGKKITTYTREIVSCNTLEVEAGTNGYHGGDTGHGSRTYFRIKNLASTDIHIKTTGESVSITLGGDSELFTIIKALKFITKTLEREAKTNTQNNKE